MSNGHVRLNSYVNETETWPDYSDQILRVRKQAQKQLSIIVVFTSMIAKHLCTLEFNGKRSSCRSFDTHSLSREDSGIVSPRIRIGSSIRTLCIGSPPQPGTRMFVCNSHTSMAYHTWRIGSPPQPGTRMFVCNSRTSMAYHTWRIGSPPQPGTRMFVCKSRTRKERK